MTKLNSHWKNKPFLLQPSHKDHLWGGTRLNDDFSKNIDCYPLAETWECSTHADGASVVGSGEFVGMTLVDVLGENKEMLGKHYQDVAEFPILVKLIDANTDLSIQVHPDDEYANKHENGQNGKTELWYVLDATSDATIYYGLEHATDKETLASSVESGTLERYLQKVAVKKNDVFYIKAGTIHAICGGVLVAEIQQNSNLTYRLYDYNRVDKNGNKRELHLDKALQVAKLKADKEPKQPLRVLKYKKGVALEKLCQNQYFQVERMIINTERCREMSKMQTDEMSFQVLLCVDGCGSVICEDEVIHYFKGDCIFVPANSCELKIHGNAQFLKVSC